jgi:hypothetical protein
MPDPVKKSTIIYHDALSIVDEMPDELAGKFVKSLLRLMVGEPPQDTDLTLKFALHPFAKQFERERETYIEKSGENHWNWQGGITSENRSIRNSAGYKNWRSLVFFRDEFTCKNCLNIGGELEAHHIKKFSTHDELRLDVSNGVTLCKKCHKIVHSKEVAGE